MAANSLPRRVLKTLLAPVLNERSYVYLQSMSKAWDIRSGNWSEPEIELLRYGIQQGDTVLDLGANYGLYSYYFSKAVGPSGRVFAFEPVPFTFRSLELVAKLLGLTNVTLIPKGCGSENGRIAFHVPLQASGAVSAGQAHMARRDDDREGKQEQVRWDRGSEVWAEVVRLDSVLPEVANLSWIKCDIEGAELFAFRGATDIIDRHHPSVICEINPWFLDGFGVTLEELVGLFRQRGYELYRYDTSSERRRLEPVSLDQVVEDNYVFIHPSRADAFASLLR